MALENNDISITLVKNAINSSFNNVSSLVQSENVNRWGINSPLGIQQLKYWGVFPPPAPHELGMFRGYDHRWRCYSTGTASIDEALNFYESGYVRYKIGYFPVASDLITTSAHVFNVYFNRSNDFTHSTHTQLNNNVVINNDGELSILINPFYPPDGGAALTPNSTVYIKVKHVNSPDRRWDKRVFTPTTIINTDSEDDAYIISINIGADVFTYLSTFQIESVGSTKVWKYNGNGGMHAFIKLFNSNKYDVTVNLTFEINNYSDFTGLISDSTSDDFTVPAGTRSGTTLIKGGSNIELYKLNPMSHWSVGTNFYGRVKINSVTTGGYSSTYQTGFDGTVTNLPPM